MHDLQTINWPRKNCPVIMELVENKFLLCIVNKHQFNMFTICSFFNNLLTVTGNNTMYNKNRISNRNFHSRLPIIIFQINSISSIQSEEFRETSNEFIDNLLWKNSI